MGTEKYFFSVIIPTFERPEDLRKCLNSLDQTKQKKAPPYELIVTDDSRNEDCRNLVLNQFPLVSWGEGKKIGPAITKLGFNQLFSLRLVSIMGLSKTGSTCFFGESFVRTRCGRARR